MDDAGHRVSRYLLMQLLVNVTYGTVVAIGLYFIGVPNAVLWGAFATVLRFIPYIGPWIAAAFPTLLSLAVSPQLDDAAAHPRAFRRARIALQQRDGAAGFTARSTGVSSIALIVAAVFWTWLWGPHRTGARHATHRLPRRHGAARPAPLLSQRRAQR